MNDNAKDPDNPFLQYAGRVQTQDDLYTVAELGLANRNCGTLLETLALDITPTGAHYLLNHFDVPLLDGDTHELEFDGAFANPSVIGMDDIRSMPQQTLPVTLECAGNGRAGSLPRSHSMPWNYEAVGTSEWTGTALAPLIEQAAPLDNVVDISFEGVDFGYDKACAHHFGRSLTLAQLNELDVLLVHSMNGQPLLPQHGAPLRIIVPGWYGMASVKWLGRITALTEPYQGFQQVRTYRFRNNDEDPGIPITSLRVKSLMIPPGVPDWVTRKRRVGAGPVTLKGRAWAGAGIPVETVEVDVMGEWQPAELSHSAGKYAWSQWSFNWMATPGWHTLRCRATDADGNTQPLEAPWDVSGFANNAVQQVSVFVE